jgi:hypothetical protein
MERRTKMSNGASSSDNESSPPAASSTAKSKRNSHLTVVEDAIAQAVGNAVGGAASKASHGEMLKIPAVDPLSEYMASETRRRLDAAAEIDLIDVTMEQRKATYDALISKLENEYRRAIDDETNRFSAEWTSFEEQRRNQQLILTGAEAALKAIEANGRSPGN